MKINQMHIRSLSIYLTLLFLCTIGKEGLAQTPQEKGLEIAKERKLRDRGWEDSVAELTMVLRNSQGQETERAMRLHGLENLNGGDKSLTIFDEPKDVKGTAFLNFSHAREPDDQWIYLPALKRVKRISSRNKSGPFMGSEFAYEDMTAFEVEKYTFNYVGDESYQGRKMFIVEQIPVDEFSGYTRQIVWIDQERYIPYKIEYYDKKNSILKTLELSEYELYLDKYWRAMRSEMFNEQNGKSTELITHQIEFKTGLEDSDFDKNSLKRAR
ncbi:outer membrane lipoprotein-sorting protein [Aliiglaciecola sp. 2_MG-2023]|uniref:outer membrane lipoprotein-sorting protein n=1 Tax=unclassified Aliiglaciecola TaxID=2593648 RepID=UPI0026E26C07|nr:MULTISPECIES: outer membrane lipoprotein-sorting protein [unclassified Aliiglaciecola]MDO6710005.1 outer membrane lipoprotein-sorting protein [Aliiglaciecola sp. 2_MG-2023]MDO6751153.1 outer membrane lipoprotein-sorting protein [Aliiglaciecola sp. 1_MG-2023]